MKQVELMRKIMVWPTERRKIDGIIRATPRNWNHVMDFNLMISHIYFLAAIHTSSIVSNFCIPRLRTCQPGFPL